jgi:ABC-type nickel/cobalt efflux system permease component RcnA
MNRKNILPFIFLMLSINLFANPFISPGLQTDTSSVAENSSSVKDDNSAPSKTTDPSVRISAGNTDNLKDQRSLRETLGEAFYTWKELKNSEDSEDKKKASSVLWVILSASFIFGIVHALGPGHRKTVVFSLYISRRAPWWEPLATGTALSALHAGSAIVIILLLKGLTGSISQKADVIAKWMEGFSYILLIMTAVILIVHSIIDFLRHNKELKAGKESKRNTISLGAFIVSGIYPCPGAVLVLVLSFTLGIIPLGILSVLSMSLGMSIPIIASAYFAWAGREGLFYFFKSKQNAIGLVSFIAEISGYILLFAFSLYIAWPFIAGLIR